jgi:hypothetical protein
MHVNPHQTPIVEAPISIQNHSSMLLISSIHLLFPLHSNWISPTKMKKKFLRIGVLEDTAKTLIIETPAKHWRSECTNKKIRKIFDLEKNLIQSLVTESKISTWDIKYSSFVKIQCFVNNLGIKFF